MRRCGAELMDIWQMVVFSCCFSIFSAGKLMDVVYFEFSKMNAFLTMV